MSNTEIKKPSGWKLLAKTPIYELLGKKTINELYLNLKVQNSKTLNKKQYDAVISDTSIPLQLAFFINSTSKLFQFMSNPESYSIIGKQGIIILKIPVATSQGQTKHQISIKLHEKQNNQNALMIEAIDELRKKITKIKSPKQSYAFKKLSSDKLNQANAGIESNLCIKCKGQEKLQVEKKQIDGDVKKIIEEMKQQVKRSINEEVQQRMKRVKDEIMEQMERYIKEMKLMIVKQIKEEIREGVQRVNQEKEKQVYFEVYQATGPLKQEDGEQVHQNEQKDKKDDNSESSALQYNPQNDPQQPANSFANLQTNIPIHPDHSTDSLLSKQPLNKITENLAYYINQNKQIQNFEDRILEESFIQTENSILGWKLQNSSQSQVESQSEMSYDYYFDDVSQEEDQESDSYESEENYQDYLSKVFTKKEIRKAAIRQASKYKMEDPIEDFNQNYRQWKYDSQDRKKKGVGFERPRNQKYNEQ